MPLPLLLACLMAIGIFFPDGSARPSSPGRHDHDRFVTQPAEAVREFQAFKVSFDTDEDGIALGVPDWVAYELRRNPSPKGKANPRPSRWSTDSDLHSRGIAPDDSSYRNSGYSRGHMCMKSHAGRISAKADRETHTVLNACPQLQGMNGGVWLAIENLTGQWADDFGSVWIVTGPVFLKMPCDWIGDPGEIPVAVPDAFFKIVIRDGGDDLQVLAFLVPMHGDRNHRRQTADATPYLTSVDIVESLTGLDFLSSLPSDQESILEQSIATRLWETPAKGIAPRAERSSAGADDPSGGAPSPTGG